MLAIASPEAKERFRMKLREYLPERLVDDLSRDQTVVTYSAGAIPFSQGSSADLIFFVVSGYVKVYCPVREGDRILIRIAGPGDVLGCANVAGPSGESSQAFEAQALTKCTLALTSRQSLLKLLETLDAASIVALMERMNASWSAFAQRLVSFLGLSFRQRLEVAFEELASRFGVHDERGILLGMTLSHAELAEMIDSSRPMVTRLIGEMVADGSLCRMGRQYALPASTLGRYATVQERTRYAINGPASDTANIGATVIPMSAKVRQLGRLQYRE